MAKATGKTMRVLITGEHLERPDMMRLRKLVAKRSISGVIFPALDRLSREPLHQQIFEMEATHYVIRIHHADVPNGNDPTANLPEQSWPMPQN